jgi:4,5-dihydroxyphthalate decarboxylase
MKLKIAVGRYPNTEALLDGRVGVEGADLEFVKYDSILTMSRSMVRNLDLDVVEMPLTTYIVARQFGKPITALPVFVVRVLPQFLMFANREIIQGPLDLRGKRVGVRAYTVTTGVWGRGVLARDYGLDADDVTWVAADDEHVLEYQRPANVGPALGALGDLLTSGDIAAVVGVDLDLSKLDERMDLLIDDPARAARSWLDAGRPYPLNHTVAVRSELLERHPGLASALFAAFEEARRVGADTGPALGQGSVSPRQAELRFAQSVIGRYPLTYGLEANQDSVAALIGMLSDQHIAPGGIDVGSIFAVV